MPLGRVQVVARERRGGTYGLNVVLAALTDPAQPLAAEPSVAFASTADGLIGELRRALAEHGPGDAPILALWSFYSAEAQGAFAELARVKTEVPDFRITHLAGGVHASAQPLATLLAGFDLVAIGEGEATLRHLVEALAAGRPIVDVAGLALLSADGSYRTTGPCERRALDSYPSFAANLRRINPIEITRGCIYACRFCQTPYLFRARFRHRSVDDVARHVRMLRERGLRYVRFITPSCLSYGTQTETPDLDAVARLLEATRREIGDGGKVYFGSFPSELRPEHVTAEAMAILRRYVDNRTVIIGAQSGAESVLDATKRGHSVNDVEEAVRVAIEAGFGADVDLLFGLPGEGEDEARASVALTERLIALGARIHAHTFMPLPGTPLHDAAPGRVSPAIRLDLERLTARGSLYGQWQTQERTAVRIAPLARRPLRPQKMTSPAAMDQPAG